MKNILRVLLSLGFATSLSWTALAQSVGGGGQTTGITTATQGSPNTAGNAWPTSLTIGGVLVDSTHPTFTQLTAGSASLGTVGLNAGSNIIGKFGFDQTTPGTTNAVSFIPLTGAQGGGLGPQVSGALQASSTAITGNKNLYAAYAVSTTGAAGYFVCVNATSISSGAITPVDVVPIAAGPSNAFISYGTHPANYSTGVTCAVTTAATPFTYTSGGSVFFYHVIAN